jgi:hypothetical protein
MESQYQCLRLLGAPASDKSVLSKDPTSHATNTLSSFLKKCSNLPSLDYGRSFHIAWSNTCPTCASPRWVSSHSGRQPRLIVDYSFWGVNDETVRLSPHGAMQFGRALERLLFRIRHANPRFGPTYMAKIDLADGFYRLWLAARGIPNLGAVFPTYDDVEPLVAFPLTLPMGWVESPPYFCTATETVANLANAVSTQRNLPPHPLEHLADIPPPPIELPHTSSSTHLLGHRPLPEPVAHSSLAPLRAPVLYHDIYVDDYMSLAQGTPRRRTQHWRALLHSLDDIFRPKDAQDPPQRKDVPSLKKFHQGDACYATR